MIHDPNSGGRVVDHAIVETATDCRHEHACIESREFCLCEVTPAAGGEVLFTDSPGRPGCPYTVGFGASRVCLCPVRSAIYRRYGE